MGRESSVDVTGLDEAAIGKSLAALVRRPAARPCRAAQHTHATRQHGSVRSLGCASVAALLHTRVGCST
jgi:hypothetical protein